MRHDSPLCGSVGADAAALGRALVDRPRRGRKIVAQVHRYSKRKSITPNKRHFALRARELPGMPLTFKGQDIFNMALLAGIVTATVWVIVSPATSTLFYVMIALALAFGVLFVMPIGAADMPW